MKRMNHWLRPGWAAVVLAPLLAGSHSPLIAATLMYVSNSGNGTISAVADDGSVSTFATGLQWPTGLAFDRWGNLYASDWGVGGGLVGTIKKITPDGHVSTWATGFGDPGGLAFDGAGNLFVGCSYDTIGDAIVRITPGGSVTIFSTAVHSPGALAFDRSGNLFAADYWDQTISKITPDGTVSTFASGFSGRLDALAFDAVGNLYVVNLDGYVIQKLTPQGSISTFATGEVWPGGLAFDQSGNLYLADYIANRVESVGPAGGSVSTFATGFNNPNGIAMVPHGPTIVTPPQSQTARASSSVTFSVVATGTPPLSFQWRKDGVNIAGATSPTLTLNSVGAGNSGAYSVVVWNSYGSTTSAAATLAVLTDGANGKTPVQITVSPLPPKPTGVKNLVFVTHGWQPVELNWFGPPAQPWMVEMTNDIVQQLVTSGQSSDWQVEAYYWLSDAWTWLPDTALNHANNTGTLLGKQLAAQGYQRVHLIAHSAGAALIQAIADQLKSAPNPPIIQTTFLDPYVGFDARGVSWYGSNADWSDDYFIPFDEASLAPDMGIPLPHAFAVNVSWLHVLATVTEGPFVIPISSHDWSYEFYTETVSGTASSCAADYGFPRSFEGGGWNSRGNYPIGNNPTAVPCGQSSLSQNLFPIGLGSPLSLSLSPTALSDFGAFIEGKAGFVLNSISSALPLGKSGGVHPLDDTTNTPAWLAVGVTVTNAVNFVQFDAAFTDTNVAQGLLTVYWNTNQVGMVDERVASPGLQTYRFVLPGTVSSGLYTLSFRLDSFTNSSSMAVTNVATGFVGVTQPITLGISRTNGAPLVQLTAATNFTYLIQSSTNLVDWTPTALLLNTNGTAQFIDLAVTNSNPRFYRAVMP